MPLMKRKPAVTTATGSDPDADTTNKRQKTSDGTALTANGTDEVKSATPRPRGRPRKDGSTSQPSLRTKETGQKDRRSVSEIAPDSVTNDSVTQPRKRGRPPKQQKSSATGDEKEQNNAKNEPKSETNLPLRRSTRTPNGNHQESDSKTRAENDKKKIAAKGTRRVQSGTVTRDSTEDAEPAPLPTSVIPDDQVDSHSKINLDTQYWLMKAEPDSRIEKGRDVKFSIDDLAARTEPEAWDGVRNPVARNNMRAMLQNDLAFFYHSNCKVPGIAGVMRVVREHSIDESAFDPAHPYHDPKSVREKPKWVVVHVEFVKKFDDLVTLAQLRKHAQPGGELENMQMLKQSRLSVSSVTPAEWMYILTQMAAEQADLGHGDVHEATAEDEEETSDDKIVVNVSGTGDDTDATEELEDDAAKGHVNVNAEMNRSSDGTHTGQPGTILSKLEETAA